MSGAAQYIKAFNSSADANQNTLRLTGKKSNANVLSPKKSIDDELAGKKAEEQVRLEPKSSVNDPVADGPSELKRVLGLMNARATAGVQMVFAKPSPMR